MRELPWNLTALRLCAHGSGSLVPVGRPRQGAPDTHTHTHTQRVFVSVNRL